jgi:hypothetical protein
MSLLLASALTLTGPVLPSCAWNRPGANPFMGDVVAAVDRYQDIPEEVRKTLKSRIAARKYDELATIRRDSILGAYRYTDLRDMHFAQGTICRSVNRDKWTDKTEERGLIYCEQGHCLIVPTVCRNVSRVTRVPMQKAAADAVGPEEPRNATAFLAPADPGTGELQFESPAAGASPSLVSGASGASPLLPGGSDGGLDGGSGWAGPAGLPSGSYLPPTFASPTTLAGIPTGTGSGGLPGLPPVPGITPPTFPSGGGGDVVTPVPEPSSYALMGLGLGFLGWLGRRRATKSPSAAR